MTKPFLSALAMEVAGYLNEDARWNAARSILRAAFRSLPGFDDASAAEFATLAGLPAHFPSARAAVLPDEPKRTELDGLFQYRATINNADGTPASKTVFSDWFATDDDARAGLRASLEETGYAVASVEIGFPLSIVTLA